MGSATWQIFFWWCVVEGDELVSCFSSSCRFVGVAISFTAHCVGEMSKLVASISLLRHDERRCSPELLLQIRVVVFLVAWLPTVVANGRPVLRLRLLPWLLPPVLVPFNIVLLYFVPTALLLPIQEGLATRRCDYGAVLSHMSRVATEKTCGCWQQD